MENYVIKRNGKYKPFESYKIKDAIEKSVVQKGNVEKDNIKNDSAEKDSE